MAVSRYRFIERLKVRGFENIGGGHFSHVYGKPGCKYVIKVSRDRSHVGPESREDGWLPFAEYAKRNPDKHLPKIGWIKWYRMGFFVAKIERLQPATGGRLDVVRSSREILGTGKPHSFYSRIEMPETLLKTLVGIRDAFLGKWTFDLHEQNAMLRGRTVVITDPIAFRCSVEA